MSLVKPIVWPVFHEPQTHTRTAADNISGSFADPRPRKALVFHGGGGGMNLIQRLTDDGWTVTTATTLPTVAELEAGGHSLLGLDYGYNGLTAEALTRAYEAYQAGFSVLSTGNDTTWTAANPIWTGAVNVGSAANQLIPVVPETATNHPVAEGWSAFNDGDARTYLTGVRETAVVVGSFTYQGSLVPAVIAESNPNGNGARYVHIQPYASVTPAALTLAAANWTIDRGDRAARKVTLNRRFGDNLSGDYASEVLSHSPVDYRRLGESASPFSDYSQYGNPSGTASGTITPGQNGIPGAGASTPQPSSSYAATVLDARPAGYWRLGEASGTVASDSSGYGLAGTYYGAPAFGTSGAIAGDTAVTLDGVDDRVSLGNSTTFQATSITLEAWVKAPEPGTGYRGIIVKQGAYGLFLNSNVLGAYDWSVSQWRSTGIALNDNLWHHVAMTVQSGVTDGTSIYLDGVLVLSTSITVSNQNAALVLGAGSDSTSQNIKGSIDEAAIYPGVLPAAEIKRHHDEGRGGAYAATVLRDRPAGYWRLGETRGTVVNDASGNGGHGTYVNSPALGAKGALAEDRDYAAYFNAGPYATIPDSPALYDADFMTVEAWVKFGSVSSATNTILNRRNSSNVGGFTLERSGGSGTNLNHYFRIGGAWHPVGVSVANGVWYHVAYTYDGANIIVYHNGVEVARKAVTGTIEKPAGATFQIARNIASGSAATDTTMDELAVYTRPLTAAQVKEHYDAGRPRTYLETVLDDAPVAYWRLDEDSGTVAADSSGNGFHGAYQNATLGRDGLIAEGDTAVSYTFGTSPQGILTAPSTTVSSVWTAVSVEMWVHFDAGAGTRQTTALTANSVADGRQLNIHLPWSNANVYWDAGGDAGAYDRINKALTSGELTGPHHWVFTKDTATGVMRIYLDGVLWHEGTGKTRTIKPTDSLFRPITQPETGVYDEYAVYDRALTATDVKRHYDAGRRGPYSNVVRTDGPVGYWRLGELSGTTALDSSGNGRSGTYMGSPVLGVNGALAVDTDKAVKLSSGGQTYVSVPSMGPADTSAHITAEAWANIAALPTGAGETPCLISEQYPTGTSVRFTIAYDSGGMYAGYFDGAWHSTPKVAITLGEWAHWAATYDGATLRLYRNGVEVATRADTAPLAAPGGGPWYIGRRWDYAETVNGSLDEVAVYDRALTAVEIKEHYDAGRADTSVHFTSGAIDLGNPSNLQVTENQAIVMWLRPDNFSARRNPWDKAYGGEGTITQETAGNLNYYWGTFGGNGGTYQGSNSVGTLTLSQWNQVAVVRDLTNGRLKWYINGTKTSDVTAAGYGRATRSTLVRRIGQGYAGVYNGRIDEVSEFARTLTDADILRLYQLGSGQITGLEDGGERQVNSGRSATDSAPASDAVQSKALLIRSASDSAPASDAATRKTIHPRTVGDDAPAADDGTRQPLILARSGTDSVEGTSDATTRLGTFGRTSGETAPADDSATRVSTHPRTVEDAASADDAATQQGIRSRTSADSLEGLSDAATRGLVLPRSVSDDAPATDDASRAFTGTREVSDTAPATDAPQSFATLLRTTDETVPTPTEVAERFVTFPREQADSAPATDDGIRAPLVLARAGDDTVAGVEDSITRSGTFARDGSDTAEVSDQASGQSSLYRTASDAVWAEDGLAHQALLIRGVGDSAGADDQAERSILLLRSGEDEAGASDTLATEVALWRTAEDSAPATTLTATRTFTGGRETADLLPEVTDGPTFWVGKSRTPSDAAPATDDAVRTVVFPRSVEDTAGAEDDLQHIRRRPGQAQDSIPEPIDTPTSSALLFRSQADSAPAADDGTRAPLVLARSGTEELTEVSDSGSRLGTFARSLHDGMPEAADDAVREMFALRAGEDQAAAEDEAGRTLTTFRTASDEASASDEALRSGVFLRGVSDALPGVVDSGGREVTAIRFVADQAQAEDRLERTVFIYRFPAESVEVFDLAIRAVQVSRSLSEVIPEVFDTIVSIGRLFRRAGDDYMTPDDWAYARIGEDYRVTVRVTITSVSRPKVSHVDGHETSVVTFAFDQPVLAWSVRVNSTTHLDGHPVAYWSEYPPTQYGMALVPSSILRRGENVLTVYGKSLGGIWSR